MTKPWFTVRNANGSAEIFIYEYIGMDEDSVTAMSFIAELRALQQMYSSINVRINSGGGSMQEGIPIYNFIKASTIPINIYIDGLAASMAAIIAMGGKRIYMAKNARIMTHEPQSVAVGNSTNLRDTATYMDSMRDDIAVVFAGRTGKTKEWVIENWLAAGKDKWFTAQEALDAKLIDEIYDNAINEPMANSSMEQLVAFYNPILKETNPIFLNQINPPMKKVIAALNGSKLVTLPETATEELTAEAVTTLTNQISAKDSVIQTKDKEIARLIAEAETAKTAALADKATTLVEGALAAKKIVAAQKESLVKLASQGEEGYATVKSMIDTMPSYKSVAEQLSDKDDELPASQSKRVALWDQHAKEGTLSSLSEDSIKAIYKAKHGKEISEVTLKALSAK
jgi:ATP-dependent protease ClpP protease subunit